MKKSLGIVYAVMAAAFVICPKWPVFLLIMIGLAIIHLALVPAWEGLTTPEEEPKHRAD